MGYESLFTIGSTVLAPVNNLLAQRQADEEAKRKEQQALERQGVLDQRYAIEAKRAKTLYDQKQAEYNRTLDQRNTINTTMANPDILGQGTVDVMTKRYEDIATKFKDDDKGYNEALTVLNNAASSNFDQRLDTPMLSQKELTNRYNKDLISKGVDVTTAGKISLEQAKLKAADVAKPNKLAIDAIADVYDQDSRSLRDSNVVRKPYTKGIGGFNAKDTNTLAGMYDWINKNSPKTTIGTGITGYDSGVSLKKELGNLVMSDYPVEAVAASMKKFYSGSDGTVFDTRAVDVGKIKADLDMQIKAKTLTKAKYNGGKTPNIMDAQNELDAAYLKAIGSFNAGHKKPTAMQLGFGMTGDELDARIAKIGSSKTSDNKITTNTQKGFAEGTAIGAVLNKLGNDIPAAQEQSTIQGLSSKLKGMDTKSLETLIEDGLKRYPAGSPTIIRAQEELNTRVGTKSNFDIGLDKLRLLFKNKDDKPSTVVPTKDRTFADNINALPDSELYKLTNTDLISLLKVKGVSKDTKKGITQAMARVRVPLSIQEPTENKVDKILNSRSTDLQKINKLQDLGLSTAQVQTILYK